MTQLNLFSLVMIAGLFSGSLWAEPQENAMERELLTQFAPTKFEKSKVIKAGVVLVVQKEGIGAISPERGDEHGPFGRLRSDLPKQLQERDNPA